MVVLIAGASHVGKTVLAQKLLEERGWPYLSLDLLKMGLIRSGQTPLTPEDDGKLTGYLWPIASEMVKTAIENGQNLVVEGCYIPFNWGDSFTLEYRRHIRYVCLVLSEGFIRGHFTDVLAHASDIEKRLDDESFTMEHALRENAQWQAGCQEAGLPYVLIDGTYNVPIEF